MKKTGFTLAEVLITLGIIGVIAALTLPGLMTDTTTAQIGPKLAKAVAMFEQANEGLLNDHSVDSLTDGELTTSEAAYIDALSNHLKINSYGYPADAPGVLLSNPGLSKDGMLYGLTFAEAAPDATKSPNKQYIGYVEIDINGGSKPNEYATDIFCFALYNDGTLRPKGSTNWDTNDADAAHWTTNCANDAVPTDPTYCAGSVFDNNLKVLYK